MRKRDQNENVNKVIFLFLQLPMQCLLFFFAEKRILTGQIVDNYWLTISSLSEKGPSFGRVFLTEATLGRSDWEASWLTVTAGLLLIFLWSDKEDQWASVGCLLPTLPPLQLTLMLGREFILTHILLVTAWRWRLCWRDTPVWTGWLYFIYMLCYAYVILFMRYVMYICEIILCLHIYVQCTY